jgi:hypothetical protein
MNEIANTYCNKVHYLIYKFYVGYAKIIFQIYWVEYKYIVKICFISFLFENMATRKCRFIFVAHGIYLQETQI